MQTAQSSAKAAVTITLTLTEPDHRENLIIFACHIAPLENCHQIRQQLCELSC